MKKKGVLLAVSSLPSDYGIGDFGPMAHQWLKDCKEAGFNLWQILPLNPVGVGNSPYQSTSSYAMDEVYISLDDLLQQGLIKKTKKFHPKAKRADFEQVRAFKKPYLEEAFAKFQPNSEYKKFIQFFWVKPFVTYQAIKKRSNDQAWNLWPSNYRNYNEALFEDSELKYEIEMEMFVQYQLYRQWMALRKAAKRCHIEIMGDIPFYVGLDSADVWANQSCFLLDEDGRPTFVAGVPPDYFSANGQRWGNPIYHWDKLKETDFQFWIDRLAYAKELVDCIRIDHFRAFDTYWKIPITCPTAIEGEWCEALGYDFFDTLFEKMPNISIVAEDLGLLRDEVLALRDHYHFQGMKIIQFTYLADEGIDQMEERQHCIAYSGTHDNQTLKSWCAQMSPDQKKQARLFLKQRNIKETSLPWGFMQYLFQASNEWVILAMQDILNLDDDARMNTPGTIDEKNWSWKLTSLDLFEQAIPDLIKRFQ